MERRLNIINLSHREDRIQLVNSQLFKQDLIGCLWPGILDLENSKRGISKAHKQIVSYAKNQNLPSIIIAEDDIKFTDLGGFDYFIKNEPIDYDLYLGGIYFGNIKADNSVEDFAGLTLYKIKQKFYDTFLSINEEKDIDRELSKKGKFFVCDPFVAIQHNGFSDNVKKNVNYDSHLISKKLFIQ